MDGARFDELAKVVAGISRRSLVRTALGAALGALGSSRVAAQAACPNLLCAGNPGVCGGTAGCPCCALPNGSSRCLTQAQCAQARGTVATAQATTTTTTPPTTTSTTTPTTTGTTSAPPTTATTAPPTTTTSAPTTPAPTTSASTSTTTTRGPCGTCVGTERCTGAGCCTPWVEAYRAAGHPTPEAQAGCAGGETCCGVGVCCTDQRDRTYCTVVDGTDDYNCGACGFQCGSGQDCINGQCVCADGSLPCGEDPARGKGVCCGAGTTCVGGSCQAPTTSTTSTTTSTTTTTTATTAPPTTTSTTSATSTSTTTSTTTTSTSPAPTTTSTTTTTTPGAGEVCSDSLTCPSGQLCCGPDQCYDPATGLSCRSTCDIPYGTYPLSGSCGPEPNIYIDPSPWVPPLVCTAGSCQDHQLGCFDGGGVNHGSGLTFIDGKCRIACGSSYCQDDEFCCGSSICCPTATQQCQSAPFPLQCVDVCQGAADKCGGPAGVCCSPFQTCVGDPGVCKNNCGATTCFQDTEICCGTVCCDSATQACGVNACVPKAI